MFWLTKAALPHLPAGATINTTSIQAYNPSPTLVDYATTKASINNFTKGLAQQLAHQRHPRQRCCTRTHLHSLSNGLNPRKSSRSLSPPAAPAAGANWLRPYVFLASAESSYVVGETLNSTGQPHAIGATWHHHDGDASTRWGVAVVVPAAQPSRQGRTALLADASGPAPRIRWAPADEGVMAVSLGSAGFSQSRSTGGDTSNVYSFLLPSEPPATWTLFDYWESSRSRTASHGLPSAPRTGRTRGHAPPDPTGRVKGSMVRPSGLRCSP